MKIAFTTSGSDLNATLDSRFGRASKFLIYDLETNSYEVIDNQQNMNTVQGAGIQAAETVAKAGVQAIISGHCGPKAFRALSAAGIKIFQFGSATTVAEALEKFRSGQISEARSADVEGHWA
jgi:predicted Fe-Mo cluster-binding NifX family protein